MSRDVHNHAVMSRITTARNVSNPRTCASRHGAFRSPCPILMNMTNGNAPRTMKTMATTSSEADAKNRSPGRVS